MRAISHCAKGSRGIQLCALGWLPILLPGCSDEGFGTTDDTPVSKLSLEVTIGSESDASEIFSSIKSIKLLDDGTIWIADHAGTGFLSTTPFVRRYDPAGNFLGVVSREGDGPGEYRFPGGIAQLPDGRVIVHDRYPGKLIVFDPDGSFSTEWTGRTLGISLMSIFADELPMVVTPGGDLWIQFLDAPDPMAGGELVARYIGVNSQGTLLGVVSQPDLPAVTREEVVMREGRRTMVLSPAFSPRSVFALGPDESFAIARTDEYHIGFVPLSLGVGAASSRPPRPSVIRQLPAIRVSEAERAAKRNSSRQTASSFLETEVDERDIPESRAYKPPIGFLRFSDDHRLQVDVSLPSAHSDGSWVEPRAFEVFEVDGTFVGRIALPESFRMHGMRGDRLWGVHTDLLGVETVRVYRIAWAPV